jgi:two-component system sensor kinase FixL
MTDAPSLELQALLDTTVDAVITVDQRGTVLSFNGAAERLFGYRAEEAIGRDIGMLMTETDRDRYAAYLEHYLRSGVPRIAGAGREVLARRKDGSVLQAFLSVGAIAGYHPPRFVGLLHDLTLRHQALSAVARERDRANRYLEAAQTMLVGLDLTHHVTMINRKGCEVLGYDEAHLLGSDWFGKVVPADLRAHLAGEFEALLQRRPPQAHFCEYPVLTRAGERRLVAWRCMVVEHDADEATGVLCSGDDVTDARRSELEIREARERMTHVSRLATMGEMASGIAHEINQPLAAITSYAQASARLLDSASPDLTDVRDALQQIAGQALRAGEIIRRLRSLVRNRSTTREPADLNAVIAEIEPLTRADARASDVRLSFDFAEGLPRVNLDRIQIQQVVLNLVRNSIDAVHELPSGQRSVLVRTAPAPDGSVQIFVQDNGPGVAQEIRGRLFMPFVTTKESGTGLGLAISRTIIEAHRGRLDYRPHQPQGACFAATLPADPDTPS